MVTLVGGVPAPAPGPVEARTPVSRTPWLVGLLVVVLLAVGLVTVDQRVRSSEVSALLDRAVSGRETVDYTDARIASIVRYSSPSLLRADVDPGVRASLRTLVTQTAADRLDDLRRERQRTADTRVLPWHRAQQSAKDSWLAYLDVRIAYVQGISTNFGELFRQHPQLATALSEARRAYRLAAPDRSARVQEVLGSDA